MSSGSGLALAQLRQFKINGRRLVVHFKARRGEHVSMRDLTPCRRRDA